MNEEAKNPPTVEEAQAQHTAALANEEAAVLTHEKAGEDMEAATVACVSAPAGKLDACISAKIRAREKLGILAERLSVARERSAAAAVVLKKAELVELEKVSTEADEALAAWDAKIQTIIPELVNNLAIVWREARDVHHAADAARRAAARAGGSASIPARGVVVDATKALPRGEVDVIASTAALMSWLDAAPAREQQVAEHARQRAADHERRCLQGEFGGDEQERAHLAARKWLIENGQTIPITDQARTPRMPNYAAVDSSDLFARDLVACRPVTREVE